jgi:hypothetical protein
MIYALIMILVTAGGPVAEREMWSHHLLSFTNVAECERYREILPSVFKTSPVAERARLVGAGCIPFSMAEEPAEEPRPGKERQS